MMAKSKKIFLFFLFFVCVLILSGKKSYANNVTISENGYPEISISGVKNYDYAMEVLSKVNNERANNGLDSLTIDEELTEAAMQRAAEISLYFDHTRPNGESCFTVSDMAWGENIAEWQSTPTTVMASWMNSSGHKSNILDSDWKSIGIGCFKKDGLYYWVQLFSPYDSSNTNIESGTKNVTVNVEVPVSDLNVYVNNKSNIELDVGKEATLKSTFKYNSETYTINNDGVVYSVSDKNIATIENGKIKAIKEGTVTITANVGNNSSTCTVKVVPRVISVYYKTHVQYVGWQDYVRNEAMSGTSGQSLRLEGIKIYLDNLPVDGGVEYCTHVQNIGWQNYVSDNEMSGTSGRSLRLEAIKIRLTGDIESQYDIYYRVHCQNIGWMGWAKNGESAGTAGFSYRLEGIEIKLVEKGSSAPGSTKNKFKQNVTYQTHVQDIGWQDFVNSGETAGTSGRSLRLEGIKIQVNSSDISGNVEYRTHVQNIGWQGYVKNGAMSGTSGQSLRLEAIQIKLTGNLAEQYDIYYRVHCQNIGWMGWAKNGESAGTAGYSYRLEAIQIVLVDKGGAAPGSTSNAFSEYVPVQTYVPTNTSTGYVLNTNSRKFHRPSCGTVKNMSSSNKVYTYQSRDEIIQMGYSACKDCKP